MKLIADSGSTKTDWLIKDNSNHSLVRYSTKGLNPIHLSKEELICIISSLVDNNPDITQVDSIEFYGSGCNALGSKRIAAILADLFGNDKTIVVDSDIIGAAKALFADSEGIACILGTGANSCHWKGEVNEEGRVVGKIVSQTPALGYVLGDEGSGAVLGKNLINALYKGVLPDKLRLEFESYYDINVSDVIERVYRQPAANVWLASLSPFIKNHLDIPEVEALVTDNFRLFIQRNILPYNQPGLKVSFVGSIAYHYAWQLQCAASEFDVSIGDIIKSPIEKL